MAETQLFTPSPEQGPPFLAVIGKRKGKAEITLIGDKDARKYRFRWVPSLRDMESILLHQFPNSSLRLTQVADNILIVEGAVDSAAEIQPILTLLENFLTRGGTSPGKVVNAMQVVGPMQVQLEVMIARVDRARLRQLGFNFTQSDGPWYSGSQVGNIINTPPINAPTDSLFPFPGSSTLPGSSTMTGASTLFLGLADDSSSFGAYIEALEQQNAIKVLARPVLVTMSGRPAEFLNGGEQPYVTVAGVSQNPDVQFKKFGTQLNFVPIVMGQGKIRLDLAPSVSSIDESSPSQLPGSFLPLVIKQSMHASVEMESGQTLIMGGMYQTTTEAVIRKVPCLGDLWLIGPAFRRVSHVQREQELMVLVTPRLVHPLDCHQVPPCVPGDETRSPTDCELYFHGLPEVETGGTPTRPAPGGFPAPLQYHQWDPLVPGQGVREVLPIPHPQPPVPHPAAAAHQFPERPFQPPPGQLSGFASQPGSIR
jgi:pilus assembly protein CpaC